MADSGMRRLAALRERRVDPSEPALAKALARLQQAAAPAAISKNPFSALLHKEITMLLAKVGHHRLGNVVDLLLFPLCCEVIPHGLLFGDWSLNPGFGQ